MKLYTQLTKKAFALSIVLWIVAALLFGIATLAVLSKDTFSLTKGVSSKLKTELIAEDILESLKFYILTADYDNTSFINSTLNDFEYIFPDKIMLDNRWYKIGENVHIRVQDTSSMLNVFKTPPEAIAALATTASQKQKRYVITDSITDWRDKDNIVSLNGAESSRYELIKGKKFKIRNSEAVQHKEELRLINGIDSMSEPEWNQLKERLYYANGSVVNLALVDSRYLAYLLKITESQAESLVKIQEEDITKFIKLVSSLKTYDDEAAGFYLSKQVAIEIKVSIDSATTTLKSIIDFKLLNNKLYTVIDYTIQ